MWDFGEVLRGMSGSLDITNTVCHFFLMGAARIKIPSIGYAVYIISFYLLKICWCIICQDLGMFYEFLSIIIFSWHSAV